MTAVTSSRPPCVERDVRAGPSWVSGARSSRSVSVCGRTTFVSSATTTRARMRSPNWGTAGSKLVATASGARGAMAGAEAA